MQQFAIPVAVELSDGHVVILNIWTIGRGNILPRGARWIDEKIGYWSREPTDENIFAEISVHFHEADYYGNPLPQPVRYERLGEPKPINEPPHPMAEDRVFRDALKLEGKTLVHDMVKAREIHLRNLRVDRAPVLAALDVEWMKATGQKNGKVADDIEAKRQALRDMPVSLAPAIDGASTVEELKAIKLPE